MKIPLWLPILNSCNVADAIGGCMFVVILPFHLVSSGIVATNAGIILTAQAASAMVGDFFWGFLASKFTPLPVLVVVMFLNSVVFLSCGFVSTLPSLIAIRACAGFVRPVVATEIYMVANTDLKSIKLVSMIMHGSLMLSVMLAVIMGSFIYIAAGWLGLNVVASAISLCSCLSVFLFFCRERKRKPTTGTSPDAVSNTATTKEKQRNGLGFWIPNLLWALKSSHYVQSALALWITVPWVNGFNISFTTYILTVGRFNLTPQEYAAVFAVLPICQACAMLVGIPVSRALVGYNKSLASILVVHTVAQTLLSTFAVQESAVAYSIVLYVQASSHVMLSPNLGVALKSATVELNTATSIDWDAFLTTFLRITAGTAEALAPLITFVLYQSTSGDVLIASIPVIVLPALALILHVRSSCIEYSKTRPPQNSN